MPNKNTFTILFILLAISVFFNFFLSYKLLNMPLPPDNGSMVNTVPHPGGSLLF